MRAAALALPCLLSSSLAAAQQPPEVRFARPLSHWGESSGICRSDASTCGALDEDGLLPLAVDAPPAARIWLGDHLLGRDASGAIHVDLLLAARGLLAEDLARSNGAGALMSLELRVEEPLTTRDAKLRLKLSYSVVARLASRVASGAGTPAAWAAAYDASKPGPHPIAVFVSWAERRPLRDGRLDDLGRWLDGWVVPATARVGDLQLIGVAEIHPAVLGRCANCSLDEIPWPETTFRCQRVRMDTAVTVYAARTGHELAKRRFPGLAPKDCDENVQYLAVRGGISPEIEGWLQRTFVREP